MVGVMATSSRTYASMLHIPGLLHSVSLAWGRPMSTHTSARDSQTLTGKSGSVSCGISAPFSWVLVHTMFFFLCVCAFQESVYPVLWKFCNQMPLAFKGIFFGGS